MKNNQSWAHKGLLDEGNIIYAPFKPELCLDYLDPKIFKMERNLQFLRLSFMLPKQEA
jgi:hypothetical protein